MRTTLSCEMLEKGSELCGCRTQTRLALCWWIWALQGSIRSLAAGRHLMRCTFEDIRDSQSCRWPGTQVTLSLESGLPSHISVPLAALTS